MWRSAAAGSLGAPFKTKPRNIAIFWDIRKPGFMIYDLMIYDFFQPRKDGRIMHRRSRV
jgi:hypothetical protein